MDQRNLISGGIFFLLASYVLLTSLGLGIGSLSNPQPGFMPFCTGLLLMVFSVILFGIAYRDKSAVRWSDLWHGARWQKSFAAGAALAAYVFALPFFGFLVATAMLMAILFKLGGLKIWTSALGALLSSFGAYALFSYALQTPLPRGIWGF